MTAYNVINPASLVAGQPEDVSQILANLNAIATVLNGGIDNANINAAAAIAISKLAAYPADITKVLRGDGSWAIPGETLICDSLLGAPAASFDTNTILGGNIPQIYKHLRLELYGGTNNAGTQFVSMRTNGDAGANYHYSYVQFINAAITAAAQVAQIQANIGVVPPQISPGGTTVVDFLDYTNAARKVWQMLSYGAGDSTGGAAGMFTMFGGGHTLAAGAITRIAVFPIGNNFLTGSRFSLYGR